MGKRLEHLFQFIRWGLLTGAASMLTLGMNTLPAAADELNDWGYDSQTRSLTITLPPNISPSVSVLASDQLLIALPNTQIGDVAGLTVGDGVVDNIVLEQTTPETLWMIIEFAEGTVLANTQSVVPVGGGVDSAGQQWEVRPAVVASSGVGSNAIANGPTVNGGGAESLRTPAVDVAQADFPDLPILEPGVVLSEPVRVPSIPPASIPAPPPVVEASRPAIGVPDVPEEVAEQVVEEVAEEVIASEESVPIEVISNDLGEANTGDEVAASADVPAEPPFLGEGSFEVPVINETALSEDRSDEFAEDSVEADEPVAVATPEEPVPTMEADKTPVAAVAAAEREPTVEADVVPGDTVAAAPGLQTRVDASAAVEPAPVADKFEPEQIDFSAQGVTPQNTTNRWPDPIPFGVPLP